MWTHHHSDSTFLQLADRDQRPCHVRNKDQSTNTVLVLNHLLTSVLYLGTGRGSQRRAPRVVWTSGPQAHMRADRLKPQLHWPPSLAQSIPPFPRGHQDSPRGSNHPARSCSLVTVLLRAPQRPGCQTKRLFHCVHTLLVLVFLECPAVSFAVTFPVTVATDHLSISFAAGSFSLFLLLPLPSPFFPLR